MTSRSSLPGNSSSGKRYARSRSRRGIVSSPKRIAITGMAVNTPLGDTLAAFLGGLLAGRSAVTTWKRLDTSRIYAKVGGDLSDYDVRGRVVALADHVPADAHRRLRKLVASAAWSTQLS